MKKGYQPKGKLGSGSRFKAVSEEAASEYVSKGYSPKKAKQIGSAIAAKAGAKKYSQAKMSKMANKKKK